MYFAVTTSSSVGFGDIVPVTQTARIMVTIQKVGDLVVVGIVARVILGAVPCRPFCAATSLGPNRTELPGLAPQRPRLAGDY